ncbi:MAG: cell envelope integrity protein CreD [Gammaproteobacteria bacterium]|nr:cell envelope integrity protein CreD [Gammaproteobacteria bacterium]
MNSVIGALRQTTIGKALLIAALTLVLLVPLSMIRGLIEERAQTAGHAHADIARSWGGPQTIGAPIVVVPFSYRVERLTGGGAMTAVTELYVLPSEFTIEGDAGTQVLKRGIFDVPVYTASLSISGVLEPPAFDSASFPELEPAWSDAVLALPIGDPRSITAPVRITVGDATAEFDAGGERVRGFGPQLIVPLTELGLESFSTPQDFSLELALRGSGSLGFLPLGDSTAVTLASDGPHPSFNGSHLPVERSVNDSGFTASWRVLGLGRGYPSSWTQAMPDVSTPIGDTAIGLGVDFRPSLPVHATNLRAVKYGILFVGLSFIALFSLEIFKRLRLHAMHYLSVGMANAVFYLLLLALSEHIGFGLAYAISGTAATLLIVGYSSAILGSRWHAAPIAVLLTATYTQLYMILNAEDIALLIGALSLFGLLTAFMYLTRHVDWFAVDRATPMAPADNSAARAG